MQIASGFELVRISIVITCRKIKLASFPTPGSAEVPRASITRMEENIAKLKLKTELSAWEQLLVPQLIKKLVYWDEEFKHHHQAIMDLVDEDEQETLEQEYAIFNDYDDKVTTFTLRLQQLQLMSEIKSSSALATSHAQRISKRLRYLESEIRTINDMVEYMSPGPDLDICLLRQLEESIASHGLELSEATRDVLALDGEEGGLIEQSSRIKGALFDSSLKTKRLLHDHMSSPKSLAPTSVKLPKISVPTFDCSILNWTTFYDQFNIAIRSSTHLSDSQKLVYLRESIKDDQAKSVIEGLSQSSQSYSEEIDCLMQRYDRPTLVHQAHVRAIVDTPPLRDGSGRELRRLHDVANQHLRALKTLGSDPSGEFETSLLELKSTRGLLPFGRSPRVIRRAFHIIPNYWNFWIYKLELRKTPFSRQARKCRVRRTKNP